jgi:hypothetical protein
MGIAGLVMAVPALALASLVGSQHPHVTASKKPSTAQSTGAVAARKDVDAWTLHSNHSHAMTMAATKT